MDLLEYQAKELFREMGIPVLSSQRIDHPKDLKGLKIPYPVVLKSQVRAGGRGKAGGIKFVENTIDAIAAAQTIFNLPIMGEYPEVLLAEAKYDANQEFYLAVAIDPSARRPVLLGSQHGGVQLEASLEKMQQVMVDQEFSPFYARRLALKMGLQGALIQSISAVVEKMYRLFVQKDLDLVEINPLGISIKGEVMALDGKVTANDDALHRHPDLAQLAVKRSQRMKETAAQSAGQYRRFAKLPFLIEMEGNIGILCNGAGLTMTTLDLVHQAGGKPANLLNIGRDFYSDRMPAALPERIEQGLELILRDKSARVVLVNLLGNIVSCDEIAQTITTYMQNKNWAGRIPRLIVRLVGPDFETAKERLAAQQITLTESLDEAIAQVVSSSRSNAKQA
ncbi:MULTISPECIES: succinate--CoA ligase subunit beta [Trichocoleus]|uniref:Succinate--CoA ligase subunit beta n=1 Tax=Trichocoleus desertorum GB2-A4 TaxID=2933944 RepID=A0ABV0J4E9_9CYAN|nr:MULTISPECIES: succinate--CoA ligase subunit beta [unclassified Trichocoleus]MBD1862002.1 succinate--CoA ligase subunit beta [Trichocoleus sp. FACHB-46]MBD2122940.1 succinate--CoA ligase subunit beta [Trichocoleus sp. FACHB-262]